MEIGYFVSLGWVDNWRVWASLYSGYKVHSPSAKVPESVKDGEPLTVEGVARFVRFTTFCPDTFMDNSGVFYLSRELCANVEQLNGTLGYADCFIHQALSIPWRPGDLISEEQRRQIERWGLNRKARLVNSETGRPTHRAIIAPIIHWYCKNNHSDARRTTMMRTTSARDRDDIILSESNATAEELLCRYGAYRCYNALVCNKGLFDYLVQFTSDNKYITHHWLGNPSP